MKHLHFSLILFACLAVIAVVASAQDAATKKVHTENKDNWNQFRGPNGNGKSLRTNLPLEFNETNNIRWKTPIHDRGWSSPVVWGKQIWMTTGREDGTQLFAICVDLESGEIIHDIKVFDVADPQLELPDMNSHATPTPIIEEGRVYVHFGTYGTACLDTKSGKKLWERRDLNCDHRVRAGSSPIIDGDSLFLAFDGVDVQFIVALDKKTGSTLWKRDRGDAAMLRPEGIADAEEAAIDGKNDNKKAFATPTIIEYEGKQQLISPAAGVTYSYDPKSGEELWRVHHPRRGWDSSCRPIFEHGLVYLTTGIARHLLAVKPSGSGDVTETHVAWT